jgi:opacity protein-like surface antigen
MTRKILLLAVAVSALTASAAPATTATKTSSTRKVSSEPAHHSSLGLKQVGVALGYVSPENVDGAFSFGGFADWGQIAPNWGLESRIDYWSHSESSFGADASIHDIVVGARTKYYFPVANPKLQPFAGGGLGLHFLEAKVETPAQPGIPAMSLSSSDTKLGIDLGGGVAMPINMKANFLGEAWYTVVSDVSQLQLRAGVSFKL